MPKDNELPALAQWAIGAGAGVAINIVLSVSASAFFIVAMIIHPSAAPHATTTAPSRWRRGAVTGVNEHVPARVRRDAQLPHTLPTCPLHSLSVPQSLATVACAAELSRRALGRPDPGVPLHTVARVTPVPGTEAQTPVIVAQIDSDDDGSADLAPEAVAEVQPFASARRPAQHQQHQQGSKAGRDPSKLLPPVIPGVMEVVHIPVDAEMGE
jgi:hypothetical protein